MEIYCTFIKIIKPIHMKINKLLPILFFSSQLLMAQTQIENGNFESWENSGNDDQEPSQWSSLKTSDDDSWLNLSNQAPQVIWKETSSPHSGNACIKLKVAPYNALVGLSPNAIVTNGRVFASTTPSDGYVFTDVSNSQWNTICNDKPDSLAGWYKYAPQSNDKGKIEVLFHTNSHQGKLPESINYSHWVGNGDIQFTSPKSSWTRFSFKIEYNTPILPNYFLIISSAGDGLNAQENSQLWLDDMSFIYNPPVSIFETQSKDYFITAYDSEIKFDLEADFINANIKLFSLDGKVVLDKSLESNKGTIQSQLSNGIYIYQLNVDGEVFSGKVGW